MTASNRNRSYSDLDLRPICALSVILDYCNSIDEHQTVKAPVVAVVIGGGYKTFQKAREQLLTSRTAVLAFAESGGAADFIATAYDAINDTANTLAL